MEHRRRIIVCFEDDPSVANVTGLELGDAFPDFQIVTGLTDIDNAKDEGLLCLLKTTNLPNFEEAVARTALITTDGNLGANKKPGWEIAEKYREYGFRGPILFTGTTKMPKSFEHHYNNINVPKMPEELIPIVRKYLISMPV